MTVTLLNPCQNWCLSADHKLLHPYNRLSAGDANSAMDVELAKTFLAVIETGSFVHAAERVHVTQSTVSTRIRTLEQRLGKTLFERGKNGAILTSDGQRFQKFAQNMVRIWEHARLEVALPEGYQSSLAVGAQYSLWDGFLLDWLSRMRVETPDTAIKTAFGFSSGLMQQLVDGALDLAVMYTPQNRPGFEIELLFEEDLILVTGKAPDAHRDFTGYVLDKDYVYVDWGPEFQADHGLHFQGVKTPGMYMELGSLSLKYVLNHKATGYFPRRLVAQYLATGKLHVVHGAPAFSYPAYAVCSSEADEIIVSSALPLLRETAKTLAAF